MQVFSMTLVTAMYWKTRNLQTLKILVDLQFNKTCYSFVKYCLHIFIFGTNLYKHIFFFVTCFIDFKSLDLVILT